VSGPDRLTVLYSGQRYVYVDVRLLDGGKMEDKEDPNNEDFGASVVCGREGVTG
jgi:hypothetical protein